MIIKSLWDKYGIYAGILALVVDIITLLGYLDLNARWNIASNTSGYLPIEQHRFLFITSLALIVFGFVSLLYYLPQKEGFYRSIVSVSGYDVEYGVGIYTIMVVISITAPVILTWVRGFVG